MSEFKPQQPQSRTGCVLLILFLFGTMFVGYAVVRLIFWLNGEPMPTG
jgi:hypothetical protein